MLERLDGSRSGAASEPSAASRFLRQEVDGPVEPDGKDFLDVGEVGVLAVMQDERTIAAETGADCLARFRVEADFAGEGEELLGLFEGQRFWRPAFGEGRPFRLVTITKLHIWAEAAGLQEHVEAGLVVGAQNAVAGQSLRRAAGGGIRELHRVAALGVVRAADESAELAELQRQLASTAIGAAARIAAIGLGREDMVGQHDVEGVENLRDAQVLDLVGLLGEVGPELAQNVLPAQLAGRDLIELLLEKGGEVIFDELGEEALEEGGDDATAVLGDQRPFFEANVVPVLQYRDGRRIGRRAADAELFHLLDEAGFAVARRRLGEMLFDQRFVKLGGVADGERRQFLAVLVVFIAIGGRLDAVERQKAREGHNRADGAKHDRLAGGIDRDVRRRALDLGRTGLRGEGAAPDEAVKLLHVRIADGVGMAEHVGRPDGFVRFLGVLGLGLVDARRRRQVGGAELLLDGGAGRGDGFRGHLHAIGSHIGDDAFLVEALGDLHSPVGRHAQPRRGILLQARGGERRIGVALGRLLVDRTDLELAGLDRGLEGIGALAGGDGELVGNLAVD